MAVVSGIIAPFAGRISDRISGRWIAAFGFCMLGLGIAMLAAGARAEASGTTMLVPFAICGVGVACIFSPLANLATYGLDPRLVGAGSGVFATTRQVGGVIGSAAIGVLLQSRLAVELPVHARASAIALPPAYRRGFIAGVTRSATGGSDFSTAAVPLPSDTPAGIARQIQALGGHAFDVAFAGAMKVTLMLPIAVLAVGVLACLAMRRPAIGDTRAPAPDAAEESRPDSAEVTDAR
jgi:MFS family permease